jgi:hypothetical protein
MTDYPIYLNETLDDFERAIDGIEQFIADRPIYVLEEEGEVRCSK